MEWLGNLREKYCKNKVILSKNIIKNIACLVSLIFLFLLTINPSELLNKAENVNISITLA